jgi:hypothetical protein
MVSAGGCALTGLLQESLEVGGELVGRGVALPSAFLEAFRSTL